MERDLSERGKKPTGRRALTLWRQHREGFVRTRKETDRLTAYLRTGDGIGRLVRTRRETDRPTRAHQLETASGGFCQNTKSTDGLTCTHFLETASRETCQVTERNRPTDAHLPTGDSIERDLSGYGKKPTDRRVLTNWRRHREGLVRTREETDRPTCTHFLEKATRGICQDTEGHRPADAHSLSGYDIG